MIEFPLEHGPQAPAAARRIVRDVLACTGWDEDLLYEILLVVSELVTNAVTHALPPVALHLGFKVGAAEALHVQVTDGGRNRHPTAWTAERDPDERGHGRAVVAALTMESGTSDSPEELIDHWATFDTP